MTPWTVACQAPLSMGFCRQEYWSGLPWPPPEDLPDPGIEPGFPELQADSLLSEPPGKPRATPKKTGVLLVRKNGRKDNRCTASSVSPVPYCLIVIKKMKIRTTLGLGLRGH